MKTFWGTISILYSKNIAVNYPKRSQSSLHSRWTTLRQAVNKFQGCFAQIENRNPSGTNEENKIEEAKLMFKKINKASFTFLHCWKVLRTQPKWITRNSLPSNIRVSSPFSPAIQDSTDLENNNDSDKPSQNIERPLGRKAEKEALKKRKGKVKEDHIGDILGDWKEHRLEMHEKILKMQDEKMKIFSIESEKNMKNEKEKIDFENKRFDFEASKFLIESENNAKLENDKINIEKKKIELEVKKFRHQQVQQEMNIVLMDKSSFNEEQRKYIESLRREILSRNIEL